MNATDNFPDLSGSSVLIVDDNPRNLQLISSLLKNQGYKLYITNSGENALKFLETTLPDLILLDVMMPGMSGYELCRLLKKQERLRNIPVIFLTAKTELEDIIEGFDSGAVDYISKPFRSQEVIARISTHLQLKLTQRMLANKNEQLEELNHQLVNSKIIIEEDAKNLARLNSEKDKFFSIIAHDLRGPLASMNGISELILNKIGKVSSKDLKELALLLTESSNQVFGLLENLLDWSRVQMNVTTYHPEFLPLHSLASSALQVLSNDFMRKNLKVTNNISENIIAFADQNMLKTIIRNLTSNAMKFTPSGGKIDLNAVMVAPDSLQITVTDTGIGMSSLILGKLFKLDEKISRTGTDGEPSSGIGLLLVKDLVEKHQGQITAKSEVQKGSTFTVILPNQHLE